jgi:hypothetical protein
LRRGGLNQAESAGVSRVPCGKEKEAERVRELIDWGILVKSESPYATNNILVGKKRNAYGSAEGMRVTSYFRALNAVTDYLAYPMEDVKNIVR